MAENTLSFALGVDLGTTSVKIIVADVGTKETLFSHKEQHHADATLNNKHKEQDPQKIISTLEKCMTFLPDKFKTNISHIGFCGQMHGVVLWRSDAVEIRDGKIILEDCSNLITWEDGRCGGDFLHSLPQPESHLPLASGFGCASLFWLKKHELLMGYDRAGSIADLVVCALTGLSEPFMSPQMAASWGYFNCTEQKWNNDILQHAGFPTHLLPTVGSSQSQTLSTEWCGVEPGCVLSPAQGDLQCTALSCLSSPSHAALNLSTSAQLMCMMPADFHPTSSPPSPPSPIQFFPYFSSRYLAVAASLNGGNVLQILVDTIKKWTEELGLDCSKQHVWETLQRQSDGDCDRSSQINVSPVLYGERHAPNIRGSVTNISTNPLSLNAIYKATVVGLITNLSRMMPKEFLAQNGISEIIASGSVIENNLSVVTDVQKVYGLPVAAGFNADAAFGAALAVIGALV